MLNSTLTISSGHFQAVNKLAEIMNRKEVQSGHRINDMDIRRIEKDNRKLQQALKTEREKFNDAIIKYQKEISDMQAVSQVSVHYLPCSLPTMYLQLER